MDLDSPMEGSWELLDNPLYVTEEGDKFKHVNRVRDVECIGVEKRHQPSKHFVYVLQVSWTDGVKHPVYRQYTAFFDLMVHLREEYKGRHDILIPDLPSLKHFEKAWPFAREATAERRKSAIAEFCQAIIRLPHEVSCSNTVLGFFEAWYSDFAQLPPTSTASVPRGCRKSCEASTTSAVLAPRSAQSLERNNSPRTSENLYDEIPATFITHGVTPRTRTRSNSLDLTGAGSSEKALKTAKSLDDVLGDTHAAPIYKATINYTCSKTGDVGLQVGDKVEVLERNLNGWWFVYNERTREQGWTPGAFLEAQVDPEHHEKENEFPDAHRTEDFPAGYSAIGDFIAKHPDEVSYRRGDLVQVLRTSLDGWWTISCNGEVGKAPAMHLEKVSPNVLYTHADVQALCDRTKKTLQESGRFGQKSVYQREPPPRKNISSHSFENNPDLSHLYAKVIKKKAQESAANSYSPSSTGSGTHRQRPPPLPAGARTSHSRPPTLPPAYGTVELKPPPPAKEQTNTQEFRAAPALPGSSEDQSGRSTSPLPGASPHKVRAAPALPGAPSTNSTLSSTGSTMGGCTSSHEPRDEAYAPTKKPTQHPAATGGITYTEVCFDANGEVQVPSTFVRPDASTVVYTDVIVPQPGSSPELVDANQNTQMQVGRKGPVYENVQPSGPILYENVCADECKPEKDHGSNTTPFSLRPQPSPRLHLKAPEVITRRRSDSTDYNIYENESFTKNRWSHMPSVDDCTVKQNAQASSNSGANNVAKIPLLQRRGAGKKQNSTEQPDSDDGHQKSFHTHHQHTEHMTSAGSMMDHPKPPSGRNAHSPPSQHSNFKSSSSNSHVGAPSSRHVHPKVAPVPTPRKSSLPCQASDSHSNGSEGHIKSTHENGHAGKASSPTHKLEQPVIPTARSAVSPKLARQEYENVPLTNNYEEEAWFVGKMSRHECESILMQNAGQRDFMVRESTNRVGDFTLSVRYQDRIRHFPIQRTAAGRYLIGKHNFKDLSQVMFYYQSHALFYDQKDAPVSLANPCPISTL